MRTITYLRISTNKQDLDNQRLSILDYAYKNKIEIDSFIEIQISAIVTELSRLGRSLGQIIRYVLL